MGHDFFVGSGESGKSTIVKQMKIIHQSGYTKEELFTWRSIVYKNVLESAQVLVLAIKKQADEDKYHFKDEVTKT